MVASKGSHPPDDDPDAARGRTRRDARRPGLITVTLWALHATACADDATPSVSSSWACPSPWVATTLGGCGPAALLCGPDGGAAPGGCPPGDGGAPFTALPDGALTGAWREPDEPGGAPARAWRPDAGMGACPDGWGRDAAGDCAPTLPRCDGASAPVPGGACVPPASAACPAVPAPMDLPRDAVVRYVRAGAPTEGADGSQARPFGAIGDALTAAPDDAWVLVAPGIYRERVLVRGRSIHLRGACWEQTAIEPADAVSPWAVGVSGAGARLDLGDLTLRGERSGLGADGGASLRAARVRIGPAAVAAGVYVGGAGTSAALEDVLVSDLRAYGAGPSGYGVRVDTGASLTLRGVAIVGATGVGLDAVHAGTRVDAARLVVMGTREPTVASAPFLGLRALSGATVGLRGAAVRGLHGLGVAAVGAGSAFTLAEALVTDARTGLYVSLGAAMTARRVALRGDALGVDAINAGSSVLLEDAEVTGSARGGVTASEGAAVTLTRVDLARCERTGASIRGGARGVLQDVIVRDTAPDASGGFGRGVECFACAALSISRALVAGNREVGVLAAGAGATLTLDDSVVRGTAPRGDGMAGFGVASADGAALVATRVRLEANHTTSALAQGASLTFRDGWILDTREAPTGGDGLLVSLGGEASVERSVIQGATQSGAIAQGVGATLRLTAVALRDVAARASDGGGGWGVAAHRGGRVVAVGVLVERAARMGVLSYADGAEVDVADLVVTGVTGTAEGFGGGVGAFDGGHLRGARVTVLGARGAAVSAGAFERDGAEVPGATLRVDDLFVRDVRASTVDALLSRAPAVSYGVFVGRDCALDLARATVLDADWGFFHSAGSLALRRALIARQRRGAGAANLVDARHPLRLDEVALRSNASDVVQRDIDLPALRLAPPPEPALPRFTF